MPARLDTRHPRRGDWGGRLGRDKDHAAARLPVHKRSRSPVLEMRTFLQKLLPAPFHTTTSTRITGTTPQCSHQCRHITSVMKKYLIYAACMTIYDKKNHLYPNICHMTGSCRQENHYHIAIGVM